MILKNIQEKSLKGLGVRKLFSTNAVGLQPAAPCRTVITAEEAQNELKLRFNGPGQIQWVQWRVLNK